MSDNSKAVIKIIGGHAREMNELSAKYEKVCARLLDVQVKYVNVLDEKTNVDVKVRDLKRLNREAKRECAMLQESLDQCQRDVEEMMER